MEFQSCFDIIGPIMVGPSSSHTAGVVSIGKFIYELLEGAPEKAEITFYDSFAETYQGHGTDKALLGGMLGLNTDDSRIRFALEMAEEQKLAYRFNLVSDECPEYDHPNIAIVRAKRGNKEITVGGVSLGGGLSKIFKVNDEKIDLRLSTSDDFTKLANEYQSMVIERKGV